MKRQGLPRVLKDMRCFRSLLLAVAVLAAGPAPVWAFRTPDSNAASPTEHQGQLRIADAQTQPYAMNYADEAAQKLGVREGRWEAFEPRSADMPSIKGGIEGGRPMLMLQWRP